MSKAETTSESVWIWRHENAIRRAFAGNAVSQHPYHSPPGMYRACGDLIQYLRSKYKNQSGVLHLHRTSFKKRVVEFCRTHPTVVRWNRPKKGKHTHVFTSAFSSIRPEYDFVDLDALAWNTVRQVLREQD